VRPNEPFERKDADGGFGRRPAAAPTGGEGQGGGGAPLRAFDDWMVEEQRVRQGSVIDGSIATSSTAFCTGARHVFDPCFGDFNGIT